MRHRRCKTLDRRVSIRWTGPSDTAHIGRVRFSRVNRIVYTLAEAQNRMTSTHPASLLAFEGLTPRARFIRFTEHVRRVVEAHLATFWSEKLEEASVLGDDVVRVIDSARQLCLRGGKRLRAALVVASHRACQGRERE